MCSTRGMRKNMGERRVERPVAKWVDDMHRRASMDVPSTRPCS